MKPLAHLFIVNLERVPLAAGRGNRSREKMAPLTIFPFYVRDQRETDFTQTIKPHIQVEEEKFGIVSDGWQSTCSVTTDQMQEDMFATLRLFQD